MRSQRRRHTQWRIGDFEHKDEHAHEHEEQLVSADSRFPVVLKAYTRDAFAPVSRLGIKRIGSYSSSEVKTARGGLEPHFTVRGRATDSGDSGNDKRLGARASNLDRGVASLHRSQILRDL
jgi:hypothetical protein